jgi:predicted transcriptional regulator
VSRQYARPEDVHRARVVAGHTQTEAAAVLGVTRRMWAHYEAGTVLLRQEQLRLYRLATVPSAEADRARVEGVIARESNPPR